MNGLQTSVVQSSLHNTTSNPYSGSESIAATYTGAGANGYARIQHEVQWGQGDAVEYGMALYLPVGFKQAQQGQVGLARWDNWSDSPTNTDQGGLVLRSTGELVLIHQKLGTSIYVEVSSRIPVQEGKWNLISIRQNLDASDGNALNVLTVNGSEVSRSSKANMSPGQRITRIRFGLVSIDAGQQTNDLTLNFDRAVAATCGS